MLEDLSLFFEIIDWGEFFLFSLLCLATLIVGGIFSFLVKVLWHLYLELERKTKNYVTVAVFFIVTMSLYFFVVINKLLWFTPEENKKIYLQPPPYLFLLVLILVGLLGLVFWKNYKHKETTQEKELTLSSGINISIEIGSMELRIAALLGIGKKDPEQEKAIWLEAKKILEEEVFKEFLPPKDE